ncbi:MAG: Mut7-C ubiquitin/RNAse domain-containing protein [Desulfuromonas sp.]|nr:Mut7-C ubiquitin/RNAse domain-containing protein [Desulfuromonas sp.]
MALEQSWASFHFYAQLNDFLPLRRRQCRFGAPFHGRPAVKDTVEALGVPHVEIDLIVVNGRSVEFGYQLEDGDRLQIYPLSAQSMVTPVIHLQPLLPDPVQFILDVHLGKLARYLRLLGFDCLYRNDYSDEQLVALAQPQRLLLTRDLGVLKRSAVRYGYWLRSTQPREQLSEVVARYRLQPLIRPFSRCPWCNGRIEPVAKAQISQRLPERTRRYYQHFSQCNQCRKIYWQGSHWASIQHLIEQLNSR